MQLSEIGKFAEIFWLQIPKQFPDIEIGNFVIMSNHVHGIVIIINSSVGGCPKRAAFFMSQFHDNGDY